MIISNFPVGGGGGNSERVFMTDLFITSGKWTAPPGVTEVSAMLFGGGGYDGNGGLASGDVGTSSYSGGGGGGYGGNGGNGGMCGGGGYGPVNLAAGGHANKGSSTASASSPGKSGVAILQYWVEVKI